MMYAFVGIDPSITNTGLVILDSSGSVLEAADGKMAYKGHKFQCSTEKYIRQADYLIRILSRYKGMIAGIAYENYSFNSVHKGYSLAEYGGILKSRLWQDLNCDVHLIAPATNKKFATGFGMCGKNAVIECAQKEVTRFWEHKPSEDIADAYFLARIAMYLSLPETSAGLDRNCPHAAVRSEIASRLRGYESLEAAND